LSPTLPCGIPDAPAPDEDELLAGAAEDELLAGAAEDDVDEPPPQAARSRAPATSEAASQARGRLMMVEFMGL
jgi:hypothetical protein